MFINNKDKRDKNEKSGIYEISCQNCNAKYIGQCGRNIGSRINEHKKSIADRRNCTGFSEHCITAKHNIDKDVSKILKVCNKGRLMNAWENLMIKKAIRSNVFLTNEVTDLGNSPLIDIFCKSGYI